MRKLTLIAAIFIIGVVITTPIFLVRPVRAGAPVTATETLRPNAVGTYTTWTPSGATNNWECVDEETPDGDATYVYTSAKKANDTYALQDHAEGIGTITNVRVYATAKGATGSKLKIGVYTNASLELGATLTLTTSYVDYYAEWAQNPVTLSDWTWTEIDALEAGIQPFVAVQTDVTTVWVVVSFQACTTWDSFLSDYSTPCDDYNSGTSSIIYMKGTGFSSGSYKVRYYDANSVQVGTDDNITVPMGGEPVDVLKSNLACYTNPSAKDGTWNAKVYTSSGTTLLADDTFIVQVDVIPEFPTVIAAVSVAMLCFGIYWWMKKRRHSTCQGQKSF